MSARVMAKLWRSIILALAAGVSPAFAIRSAGAASGDSSSSSDHGLANKTGFGLLDTICVISTVATAVEAKNTLDFKLQRSADLLTQEHLLDVQHEFEAWVSHGNDSRAADFAKHDPFVQMQGVLEILENLEKHCVPREGFWHHALRWGQHLVNLWQKASDDEYEAKQRLQENAQQAIKELVARVRVAYTKIVKDHCVDFETVALERTEQAANLIREWEDISKQSWFLMNKQAFWHHDVKLPGGVSESVIPKMNALCLPRWLPPGGRLPALSSEKVTEGFVTVTEAMRLRQLFNDIASLLGQAGTFFETLHTVCDWELSAEKRAAYPEAGRLVDCDEYLNIQEWSHTIRKVAGAVVNKVDAVLSHPALGFEADLENMYHIVTGLSDQAALPLASIITWAVLKTAQSVDPFDVCLRAADAISGNAITYNDLVGKAESEDPNDLYLPVD